MCYIAVFSVFHPRLRMKFNGEAISIQQSIRPVHNSNEHSSNIQSCTYSQNLLLSYPSAPEILQQATDMYQSQTAGDEFVSHYPTLGQTENILESVMWMTYKLRLVFYGRLSVQ